MSLFDGIAPLDHLLEGIVRSPVYVALRKDFKDDATLFGAGTAEDPYDGSQTSGGVCKFDTIMRTLVAANTTVYLGPGIFPTKGYKSDGSGWAALSGVRIVGGGWAGPNGVDGKGVTVLKLDAQADANAVAVGCADNVELDGFEMTELSIDCNFLGGTGTAAAAINLNGKHVHVHNVRVSNFGAASGVTCNVITLARPNTGAIA